MDQKIEESRIEELPKLRKVAPKVEPEKPKEEPKKKKVVKPKAKKYEDLPEIPDYERPELEKYERNEFEASQREKAISTPVSQPQQATPSVAEPAEDKPKNGLPKVFSFAFLNICMNVLIIFLSEDF